MSTDMAVLGRTPQAILFKGAVKICMHLSDPIKPVILTPL